LGLWNERTRRKLALLDSSSDFSRVSQEEKFLKLPLHMDNTRFRETALEILSDLGRRDRFWQGSDFSEAGLRLTVCAEGTAEVELSLLRARACSENG
jgi:hypothetical protein